jgi:cyclase
MLKTRIIPTLLWKDYGLVKGENFDSWRRVGTVLPAIKVYNTREVDELIIVNITATSQKKDPDYEAVAEFSSECFVPLTVGGGIRTIEHIKQLLRAGADKVCINTASYKNPKLIEEASSCFGTQCIVASIDAKRMADENYQCYSHCGTKPEGRTPGEWANELEKLGAGEILITSIDSDGTMKGYDLELISEVSNATNIPVIASGGAGEYKDMLHAINHAGANAVAAASIFHFTQQTPQGAKNYLGEKGISIRITI